MLGIYIELVETETVMKESPLNLSFVIGHYKQRKERTKHQAMPEIGPIPVLDTDSQGIG